MPRCIPKAPHGHGAASGWMRGCSARMDPSMGTWRGSPVACGSSIRTQRRRQWVWVLWSCRGGCWEAAVSADTLWWLHQPQGQALSATQDVGGDGDRADPSLGPPHALSAWREGRASASPAAPPFFIAAINNPGWCCPDGTAPLPEPEGPEHQQGRAFTSLGKGKATLYPIEDPITLNEVPVVMGFLPQRAENRQNSCPG